MTIQKQYSVSIISYQLGIESHIDTDTSLFKSIKSHFGILSTWSHRINKDVNRSSSLTLNILEVVKDANTVLLQNLARLGYLNKSAECHEAIARLTEVVDYTYSKLYSKLMEMVNV